MLSWFKRRPPEEVEDRWLIARTRDEGVDVLFRMRDQVPRGISRARYPRVVAICWRYDGSANAGMPPSSVLDRMDDLEERLDPLEGPSLGFLVVAITGNHRKEWIWHVADDQAFMRALNETLAGVEPFPLELAARDDPHWETFDTMRKQVRT